MTALILTLGLMAIALCAFGSWFVRALGRRATLFDSAGAQGHSKKLRTVPNLGGIALYWTIAVPILITLALAWWLPASSVDALPDAVEPHLPGIRQQTPLALGLIALLAVLHAMGLIDDRRALGPWLKLGVMTAAAIALPVFFDVRLLSFLDTHVGGSWVSIVLTVVWIVLVTNAMNFVDNMDGQAAGITAVASGLFLVAALVNGQWFVAAILSLLTGSAIGFLFFNAPLRGGATLFLGDGGSLVIGFLLAFLTVRTTYVGGPSQWSSQAAWYATLMPLCVLAVPIYDCFSVVTIRLLQGKNPLVGDRQHFSHRLRARGLSEMQVLLVVCACTAITGIGGIVLSRAQPWQAILVGVQVALILLVLAVNEFAGKNVHEVGS